MAIVNQNNVQFKSYKPAGVQVGTGPLCIQGATGVDNQYGGVINAVDIDWNNAQLPTGNTTTGGNLEINTTGELLDLINKMQDEIYVLTAAVISLSEQISNQ